MGCSAAKGAPAALDTNDAGRSSSRSDATSSNRSKSRQSTLLSSKGAKGVKKEDAFDPTNLILDNPRRIQNFYSVEQRLGQGGTVSRVRNKNSQAIRAVRTVIKAQMAKGAEAIKQEIAIMQQLDHPNIMKLHETFEDQRAIYFVTELCTGGELFDRIIEMGHLSEGQAAVLMQQVIGAVSYMHDRCLCHRDLQPDNFLFAGSEPIEKSKLKLVDFKFARQFEAGQVLTTKAGSTYYISPQVLAGKYDHTCDLWSCGVIMYLMLCGYPPFFGETEGEVLSKVKLGNFDFKPVDWKGVSDDAKNLIRGLLHMNPRDRFSAEHALTHDWIKKRAPKAPVGATLPSNFVDNLRGFRSLNRLKKAALHIIAGQLNGEQIKGLREVFQALDTNSDGLLTGRELKHGLLKAGLKEIPADLQQILDDVDADGSGIVDYTEFLAATLDRRLCMQEDVCWSAFRLFDRNGDGKISQEEIKYVLNNGDVNKLMDSKSMEDIMNAFDTSGDGQIDFQEFMSMMHTASS